MISWAKKTKHNFVTLHGPRRQNFGLIFSNSHSGVFRSRIQRPSSRWYSDVLHPFFKARNVCFANTLTRGLYDKNLLARRVPE